MTTTITCSVFVSLSEETSDIWRPSPVFLWSSPWSVSKYVNNVSIRQFSSPAFQRGPLFVIQSLANWPTTLLLRSLSSLIDHIEHILTRQSSTMALKPQKPPSHGDHFCWLDDDHRHLHPHMVMIVKFGWLGYDHTSYLSFASHRQDFQIPNFTPKNN